MIPAQTIRKHSLRQNLFAVPTVLAVAAACFIAVQIDRRAPLAFEYGEIVPAHATSGAEVRVRWTVAWRRQCEGELWREIVGSDNVVRYYAKSYLRVPVILGRQTSDTSFTLTEGLPRGTAIYRGVIQFSQCGVTSRIVPLTVDVPRLALAID